MALDLLGVDPQFRGLSLLALLILSHAGLSLLGWKWYCICLGREAAGQIGL
jgi:hypothetical protein